jgi:hypothetical protein
MLPIPGIFMPPHRFFIKSSVSVMAPIPGILGIEGFGMAFLR